MITETGRIILSTLLTQDHASISSRKLADLCDLSLSTIRNEINWLNEGLIPYGVHIDARQSQGCKLVIDDEEMAHQSFQHFKYELRRKLFNFNSKSYRSDYITRRLLISKEYISAEKLSEELFFSTSTILRSINHAQDVLKRYNLEIKLKKNHGLYISGNEFNRRVYLLTQHKKFMHLDPAKKALEQRFSDYFLSGSEYYRSIKKMIIHHLEAFPELEFSFINTPKLVNYLILCKHRHTCTKDIVFSDEQIKLIHSEKAYQFSEEILLKLTSFLEFTPSKQDIYSFAQIVMGCRTLSSIQQISEERKNIILPQCESILKELFEIENINIDLLSQDIIEQFALQMEVIHYRIIMQVPFDMEMFYPVKGQLTITADLSISLMKLIEKRFGYQMDESYIHSFIYLFERTLDTKDKSSILMNILVVSFYGEDYAHNAKDYLLRKYKRYIQTVRTSEYTSLLSKDLSSYDLILTDLSSSLLKMDNVLSTDFSNRFVLRTDFDKSLALQVKKKLSHLIENRCLQTKFRKKEDVFEFIAQIHQDDVMNQEAFVEDLKQRDLRVDSYRKNKLVFIGTNTTSVNRSVLTILINDKEIEWNHSKAQFFIFYAYRREERESAITIHRTLKHLLEKTSSELEELIHEKDVVAFLTPQIFS